MGDVIYAGGSNAGLDKLQRLQNKALKMVGRLDGRFPTGQLHRDAGVPLLVDRRESHLRRVAWRMVQKGLLLERNEKQTRKGDAPVLTQTRVKRAPYGRSVAHMSASLWNALPVVRRGVVGEKEFTREEKSVIRSQISDY